MNNTETSGKDDAVVCRWCETQLNSSDLTAAVNNVCARCYRLLLNAEVSEQEILSGRFKRRPPEN